MVLNNWTSCKFFPCLLPFNCLRCVIAKSSYSNFKYVLYLIKIWCLLIQLFPYHYNFLFNWCASSCWLHIFTSAYIDCIRVHMSTKPCHFFYLIRMQSMISLKWFKPIYKNQNRFQRDTGCLSANHRCDSG